MLFFRYILKHYIKIKIYIKYQWSWLINKYVSVG
jgi:hypothetical protein